MIVDQQLHGYNHGHELLSGSIKLPARDQDLVDRLSDVAGPLSPGEKLPPYITCYPLPSGSHYVVARTWHDREAPRAGCVRTRSLIIPMDDWTTFADPSALVALATEAGPTRKLKQLAVEMDEPRPLTPVPTAGVELLEALFLEDSVPVAVFGSSSAEPIALRLITAIWPSMRRRFTLSTFCNSPRTISKKSFDLVFAPVDARPRFSDWKGRRVDGTRGSASRHRWTARIADEIFVAPHPSLVGLDVFGEMAVDDRGSEEALRLSLLWGELADKMETEPHAALGLLDIANTRSARRPSLVGELSPILARATKAATSAMSPADAWRFLEVLIRKLGERRWLLSLIRSVRSSTVSLAQRHPVEAIEAIPALLTGGDFLLGGLAAGLAKAEPFEPVAKSLAGLSGDALLKTVLAAPELPKRLLAREFGIEPALEASIADGSGQGRSAARKRILPQLVDDRHAGVMRALLAGTSAGTILKETERLRDANSFTQPSLNGVLVEAARREDSVAAIRDLVATVEGSAAADAMLRDLVGPNLQDVRWILEAMDRGDARRASLLTEVLTSASNEQLRSIMSEQGMLGAVLGLIGDQAAATEVLARTAETVPMQAGDLVDLVTRLLPRLNGPRGAAIAVAGLEAALPRDLGPGRDGIVSDLLSRAAEQLNGAKALRMAIGPSVPSALASRNAVIFDQSPPAARGRLLKSPEALADAVVGRRSMDLSYVASEGVGRLLWDSEPVNHRGFLIASAKLLSFVRDQKAVSASPIIAAAFPSVYRELQRDSVSDFLSFVFPFADWDQSKVARRELARSLMNSNWRPRDIALAAARAGDAERILRNIAKRENGARALSAIEREIDTIPNPWQHQVKKAVSSIKNDPIWQKLPFDV